LRPVETASVILRLHTPSSSPIQHTHAQPTRLQNLTRRTNVIHGNFPLRAVVQSSNYRFTPRHATPHYTTPRVHHPLPTALKPPPTRNPPSATQHPSYPHRQHVTRSEPNTAKIDESETIANAKATHGHTTRKNEGGNQDFGGLEAVLIKEPCKASSRPVRRNGKKHPRKRNEGFQSQLHAIHY
jgi:hypothetical protein